ncbi:MAG: DUF853 family protein [Lachnospiraceae bacterium]|nr:DUF853 family protein [Lachnospiraceae bacterium]
MFYQEKIWLGNTKKEKVFLYPKMANRHGMIAGATGTGKTVTLKVMAESFSSMGVPVFMADVKGDLAGLCCPGEEMGVAAKRAEELGLFQEGFEFSSYPVTFWDIYKEQGLPLRTTISEMGPLLLARILELNETQSDILTVLFKIADDEGLLLLDTKDLKSMIQYVADNNKEYALEYGNMAKQSLTAILRAVIALESEGGNEFFGEAALDIRDWLRTDYEGKGSIQLLDCRKLINNPTMYSTFMLWLMSELFEALPEVGDSKKPRMVFFFDESHLLFDTAPKSLLTKIEQVVKLIRSKGVGIYFITQNPKDIPEGILGQLGCKVQHALRAYTPAEQKAAKAAAMAFRENPEFDTLEAITSLGIGEALVSVLDEEGIPTIVQRCKILPPQSRMEVLEEEIRKDEILNHILYPKYTQELDRESAYEILVKRVVQEEEEEAALKQQQAEEKEALRKQKEEEKEALRKQQAEEKEALRKQKEMEKEEQKRQAAEERELEKQRAAREREEQKKLEAARKAEEKEEKAREKRRNTAIKRVASAATGTIGREIGNQLGESVGGKFGKKLGGNVGASIGRGLLSNLFRL